MPQMLLGLIPNLGHSRNIGLIRKYHLERLSKHCLNTLACLRRAFHVHDSADLPSKCLALWRVISNDPAGSGRKRASYSRPRDRIQLRTQFVDSWRAFADIFPATHKNHRRLWTVFAYFWYPLRLAYQYLCTAANSGRIKPFCQGFTMGDAPYLRRR